MVVATSEVPTSLRVLSVEHPDNNEALFVVATAVGCNRPQTMARSKFTQDDKGLRPPIMPIDAPLMMLALANRDGLQALECIHLHLDIGVISMAVREI